MSHQGWGPPQGYGPPPQQMPPHGYGPMPPYQTPPPQKESGWGVLKVALMFEFPAVQCFVDESQRSRLASLNKGNGVTVVGHMKGRFGNVLLDPCEIR